jgi:hypothetical protein
MEGNLSILHLNLWILIFLAGRPYQLTLQKREPEGVDVVLRLRRECRRRRHS